MKHVVYKDFRESLSKLYSKGGRYQKSSEKIYALIGKANLLEADPFDGICVTNYGEHRIKHCIKRDIGDGCRLITIVNNGVTALCFAGTHEDCDKWLEKNRGLELAVNDKGEITEILTSTDITAEEKRINTNMGLSGRYLIDKISRRHIDKISGGVKYSLMERFGRLKSTATDDEILGLALEIEENEKQNLFFDVFSKLREDDAEGAQKSIELHLNEMKRLSDIEVMNIKSLDLGDSFVDFDDLEPELFEHYVKTVNFKKWMLFMHPEQKKLVEKKFAGPAKLVGVSGSGKTAIVVKRADWLARQYPQESILVLTLNKALAKLINDLINEVCPDNDRRSRIRVCSFWEICKEKLLEFESENERLYNEETWKLKEFIDEIWDEYFQCKLNNEDASVLDAVNSSLLSRSVYPKDYIRQEFDLIRSAYGPDARGQYLEMFRKGRTENFEKEYRIKILDGLSSWEEKMKFVGVIDYLGLSTALYKYIDKIKPEYRCVLVDEVQDFGTIELDIVRRFVPDDENNIFLCGDIAQQVGYKHHVLSEARIKVIGRSLSIKKNYRNSREILQAADCVLKQNVDLDNIKSDDFEILEPEYANFSSPRPLLIRAGNPNQEFGFCLNYLKNILDDRKACIAVCGYSLLDIKHIGQLLGIPVLDGDVSIDNGHIFLSDLEQTKGFEFDIMCIINCNKGVIPNPTLPEGEWYKEVAKFYVAMTRAKLSLLVSYSGQPAAILEGCRNYFEEANWSDHEDSSGIENFVLPAPLNVQKDKDGNVNEMTGREFLYTKKAVGISRELYKKMLELIDGRGATRDGRKVRWKNIGEALQERDLPAIAQQFGLQKTWHEFNSLFSG